MAEETPQPDTSVLDRILHQGGQSEVKPVEAKEGECINCANHGKSNQLKDGVCGECGYTTPHQ